MMEGPCADSEEKHEPVSDIHTVAVDSLIALDPERPIREADISRSEKQEGTPLAIVLGRVRCHSTKAVRLMDSLTLIEVTCAVATELPSV